MTNRVNEGWSQWEATQAAAWIAVPATGDDKYSRGVLGVLTGSKQYPGAAVLGVEAAARTGVGMVRYLGRGRASKLVLQRRPETVTADGRVQAWLIGSGMDSTQRSEHTTARIRSALAEGVPVVLDAGALDLVDAVTGLAIITPHYRELATVLIAHGVQTNSAEIAGDPDGWAERAARLLGVTVLLKGHRTVVAGPELAFGPRLSVATGPSWLATAGTGDVLGGIVGALVATHADALTQGGNDALVRLGASAAVLHGLAGATASAGGPLAALDVAEALSATIAAVLAERK